VIDIPECFEFLFEPSRYKAIYGGRGSGKSVAAADALLIQGAADPLRILCARELQTSIKDSVHKLLADEAARLGMADFYEIQATTIKGRNGTEFIFKGLRHNISEVKSMQGVNRCWVEEAQMVSKSSWDTLIPTIREPGSEIWLTFNPALDTDETYKRFVKDPPPGAIVRKVNHDLNPFFPDVLRDEMLHLKSKDPDAYQNVWLGHCRQTLDGAVYAKELREATEQGRITKVPYDRSKPVSTFWDLGWSDSTSIWFVQIVGFEYRIIDFVRDRQKTVEHYQKVLQDRGYTYDTHWLPHDAQSAQLAAGGRSIETQMRATGQKVRIIPKTSIADGINAARTIFPNCFFDAEKCADGLQDLRHYRFDVDPDTGQFSDKPLHDDHSHSADAWRYVAVALKEPKRADGPKKPAPKVFAQPGAWMR
jgi:phage terminase large subunit